MNPKLIEMRALAPRQQKLIESVSAKYNEFCTELCELEKENILESKLLGQDVTWVLRQDYNGIGCISLEAKEKDYEIPWLEPLAEGHHGYLLLQESSKYTMNKTISLQWNDGRVTLDIYDVKGFSAFAKENNMKIDAGDIKNEIAKLQVKIDVLKALAEMVG